MLIREDLKQMAADAGFDLCGVARCRPLTESAARFREWLDRGYQASLSYLERHTEKRFDPQKLVEEARTAVVCAVAYKNRTSEGYPPGHRAKIASYACTTDYHTTIRQMLARMLAALQAAHPGLTGRAFVDTAPLAEKQLAVEAGLGWIGRQSLLITPRYGSFVLLGELLLSDETDSYDTPFAGSRCGSCCRCIDNCPTGALVAPGVLDAGRCISCHTIEKAPTADLPLDGWIFGCDSCQSGCPYNRQAPRAANPAFDPLFDPVAMTADSWRTMTEAQFAARMGTTPLTRSGLQRIQRNLPESGETTTGPISDRSRE